jgi:surface polysaccharide O-acyltransferase-like enzyme
MKTVVNAFLGTAYIFVLVGSIVGVLRAISAIFSRSVRSSIVRHPVLHAVWFIIAVVVIFDLLSVLAANMGMRPAPNNALQPTATAPSVSTNK